MHQFCLISAAGTSKAPSSTRSPRETDQQPAMKTRRRNAVQTRRLALELRGIERNMAALASERDKEVRRLRDELQDVLAPLQPAAVVGPHLGQLFSHDPSAACRQVPSDSSDTDVTAAGRSLVDGWPADLAPTSSRCPADVRQQRFLQMPLSGDHKTMDADYCEENNTKVTESSLERYDRSISDVPSNLISYEDGSFPYESVNTKKIQSFGVLNPLRRNSSRQNFTKDTKDVLKKLRSSKNIFPSFCLKGSYDNDCERNGVTREGRMPGGPRLKVGGVVSGCGGGKDVGLHVPTDALRLPADGERTAAKTSSTASGEGRLHEQKGIDASESEDKMAHTFCPYAATANHKCTHFPCVRPCTYHSLGFHPDPSTYSWGGWIQLRAARPHHRLVRDPEQGDPPTRRYRSDEEPPADAPEFVRRRRLGKEEQLRLGTLHKKRVHDLQRPPSWNTNYGQPTSFKRLRNPVRLKSLGDETDARKMEMSLKF